MTGELYTRTSRALYFWLYDWGSIQRFGIYEILRVFQSETRSAHEGVGYRTHLGEYRHRCFQKRSIWRFSLVQCGVCGGRRKSGRSRQAILRFSTQNKLTKLWDV